MKPRAEKMSETSCQEKIARNERLLKSTEIELHEAKRRLRELENSKNDYPNPHMFDLSVKSEQSLVAFIQTRIDYLRREKNYIRDAKPDDLEYRNRLRNSVPDLLKKHLIRYKSIRFHGAQLITSLDIIDSGEISSSVERGQGQKSFDGAGQISVTDLSNIELSIEDYIDVTDKFMPLGCIFVLLPNSRADARSIRSNLMRSMKLKNGRRQSKRFLFVLTSPESLPIVQKHLVQNGYSKDTVIDFFSFVKLLENGKIPKK